MSKPQKTLLRQSSALLVIGALFVYAADATEIRDESAWDVLHASDPIAAAEASAGERGLLELLTVEQARAFGDGADPAGIELADGRTLDLALRGMVGGYDLSWWSFDSGGGTASGGGFTLTGSLGQPDAGELHGGGFTLSGGVFPQQPQAVFIDGFESGDTSAWTLTTGGSE